jgi:hypothetical protein
VPPHLPTTDEERSTEQAGPTRLTWGVRSALVFVVALLTGLFAVVAWLDPYDAEGKARKSETHTLLGLPPCTFKTLTGKPCPSCGMTTSFSLMLHVDPVNAWKANEVGVLMATFLLAVVPWALVSLARNRLVYIASLERALTWAVAVFLILLLLRWAVVLISSPLAA